MKTTFQKLKPKLIYYWGYSVFSSDKFREELLSKLSMENISNTSSSLEIFLKICVGVIDKFAPKKKKYNRGNNIAFMNKPLARAHMKRNRLQNRFLKNQVWSQQNQFYQATQLFCKSFKKNQNTILRKSKWKRVADNKKLWKTVKPLLSDKRKSNEKITVENGEIFTQDVKGTKFILFKRKKFEKSWI